MSVNKFQHQAAERLLRNSQAMTLHVGFGLGQVAQDLSLGMPHLESVAVVLQEQSELATLMLSKYMLQGVLQGSTAPRQGQK